MRPISSPPLWIIPKFSSTIPTYLPRGAAISSLHYTQCHSRTRAPAYKPLYTSLRYASSNAKPLKPLKAPKAIKVPKITLETPLPRRFQQPQQKPTSTATQKPLPYPQLNPPDIIYPPPLDLPSRERNQSYVTHLYRCGKTYMQFYKTSVKNTANWLRLASPLRKRYKKYVKKNKYPNVPPSSIVTRAEYQMALRSRSAMWRYPIFGLIVVVLGSWIAPLARFLTPIIPETCRLPSQDRRDLKKKEAFRRERLDYLARNAAEFIAQDRKAGRKITEIPPLNAKTLDWVASTKGLDRFLLLNVSSKLDAHQKIWDYFFTPPMYYLLVALGKKVKYLYTDDAMIQRDGGWQNLSDRELRRACVERGIETLDKEIPELKARLGEWFGAGRPAVKKY